MGIKTFKTRDDLEIQTIQDRKLKNKKKINFKNKIQKYNYFRLFNGFESLFLGDRNVKKYDKEDLSDFIDLYKFERQLAFNILLIISKFEVHLKSSTSYHFTKIHCNTLETTMNYTNPNLFINPDKKKYFFGNENNKKICENKRDFIFFKKGSGKNAPSTSIYLDKLINTNRDKIDPKFYRDDNYSHPLNVSVYTQDSKTAVPLWVAIQYIDFGALKRFCHYLPNDVMEGVLNDFGLKLKNREMFLNGLDVINELRNQCAHFDLLTRFTTTAPTKLRDDLIRFHKLKPKNRRTFETYASVINLYDSLKILSFYESLESIKVLHRKNYRKNKMKSLRLKYDLNGRLYKRMGNENIEDWDRLFR